MPTEAQASDRWPQFEMVAFDAPTHIPHGWDGELVSKGVPKDLLGAYHAVNELRLLETSDGVQFVRFGIYGRYGNICQDPRTGAIVDILYVPTDTTNLVSGFQGGPIFVNSGLDQFTASVLAVVSRFPFDTESARQELDPPGEDVAREWESAAEDLFEILRNIDLAVAIDPDGFWLTFVSDVQMGDYSTEIVLGDNRNP